MGEQYVWHGGDNTTGGTWATAKTTLQGGLTAATAGFTVWVAHDHAETGAVALTITAPGTSASPNRIFCVNRAGTVPPVSADLRTTATITTTGASNISTAGVVSRCYGITFDCGSGASVASWLAGGTWHFRRCAMRLMNTGGSGIRLNNGLTRMIYEDCTFQFGLAAQTMYWATGSEAIWKGSGSSITGSVFPTNLLATVACGQALFEGVDLTALSGKTLSPAQTQRSTLILKDCKLPASFTLVSGTLPHGTLELLVLRSDSGDTNYRIEKIEAGGTVTTSTSVVRTGGATDGSTPISWFVNGLAAAKPEMPLTAPPIQIWNDTTGVSKTVTVYGITSSSGSIPNNNQIWMEVAYFGTSGFPIATVTHNSVADELATATAHASDSSTWSGGTTKFKMELAITPQEKGPITVRIKHGTSSLACYIDPKVVVT